MIDFQVFSEKIYFDWCVREIRALQHTKLHSKPVKKLEPNFGTLGSFQAFYLLDARGLSKKCREKIMKNAIKLKLTETRQSRQCGTLRK